MKEYEPLPAGYNPVVKSRLIKASTGEEFTVLCNCPSSTPMEHTARYVRQHPDEYRLPVEVKASTPKE